MRADIRDLIEANNICVLATVSGGSPHCSLMSYAVDDNCSEIYMATQKDTKKYRNLIENPSVSLLIDSREANRAESKSRTKALTVTGTFQKETAQGEKNVIRTRLLKRHADMKEFLDDPEAEIIVIKISSLQLLDGITNAYFETVA